MTRYSLEVPVGDEIRDVSEILQISENSPAETNELKIKSDGGVIACIYPLEVISERDDKVVDTRVMHHDEAKALTLRPNEPQQQIRHAANICRMPRRYISSMQASRNAHLASGSF